MDKQYYILTRHPEFISVAEWVKVNNIPYELHINRMRFTPPTEALLVEFALRFAEFCPRVDPSLDLATGLKSEN